jgi:hypothetical protein
MRRPILIFLHLWSRLWEAKIPADVICHFWTPRDTGQNRSYCSGDLRGVAALEFALFIDGSSLL